MVCRLALISLHMPSYSHIIVHGCFAFIGSRLKLPPISPASGPIGNSEPPEPIPYCTVSVANNPPEPERKTPSSLHQKPPVMPRKSLKNSNSPASDMPPMVPQRPEKILPGVERIQAAAAAAAAGRDEGRTILAQVSRVQNEGDYLKVVI